MTIDNRILMIGALGLAQIKQVQIRMNVPGNSSVLNEIASASTLAYQVLCARQYGDILSDIFTITMQHPQLIVNDVVLNEDLIDKAELIWVEVSSSQPLYLLVTNTDPAQQFFDITFSYFSATTSGLEEIKRRVFRA